MARPCQLQNRHSAGLGITAGMGLGGGARVSSSRGPQPDTASGDSGGTPLSDLFSGGISVSFLFGTGGAGSFSESLPSLPLVGRTVKYPGRGKEGETLGNTGASAASQPNP